MFPLFSFLIALFCEEIELYGGECGDSSIQYPNEVCENVSGGKIASWEDSQEKEYSPKVGRRLKQVKKEMKKVA